MRFAGLVVSVFTVVFGICNAAVAQDLYRGGDRWLDDQSRTYELGSLRGSFTVVTLAYGACRRVCSTSVQFMQRVQALADERRAPVRFVVIGVAPDQDSPADWAVFRRDRGLMRDNWHFLTGDEASVRRVAQALGVRYWRYGEHTMHDFKIALLSPEGRVMRSVVAFDDDLQVLLP